MRLVQVARLPRTYLFCFGVLAFSALACSNSSKNNKTKDPPPIEAQTFSVFLTTELRGTIEPCGCNSNPLGDLARTAEIISELRKQRVVLHIDGGSTLYQTTSAVPARLAAQEQLKAALIQSSFANTLKTSAMGLGPYDLASGPKAVRRLRHAVNITASAGLPLVPPSILEAGKVKVGIFGVVEPSPTFTRHKIVVGDPVAAAIKAIAGLKARGAQVIVGLLHMARPAAIKLARKAKGMDFAVVGSHAPEPDLISDSPRRVGTTWVVQPANRGQIVTRLDITVRSAGGFGDAIGKARAARQSTVLAAELVRLETNITKWQKNGLSEPSFVQTKQKELAAMKKKLAQLKEKPLQIPAKGNYFIMDQVRIGKALACNSAIQSAKLTYDKAAGAANVKAAKNYPPDKPIEGQPKYVGAEECGSCHRKAVNFWKKTHHYQAWKTLEKVGKQFNYDCIGCHVTGWDKPGGSTMGFNKTLRNIQCEQCHGPGSIHVDEDGKDEPRTITAVPDVTVCKECHNKEHSDTFDFKPYLRDITGPGHGESYRKRLGKGATGLELRTAARKKVGATIGAGCPK